MKSQAYVIFSLILIIIVAIFAVVNVEPVEVNYLFWTGHSPLILVILFSVLMGGLIMAFSGVVKIYKLQKQIKLLRRENNELKSNSDEQGIIHDGVKDERCEVE